MGKKYKPNQLLVFFKLDSLSVWGQYFNYIMAVCFIGGGNRSTQRIQPTCYKSLTKFNTICCIEFTSPLAEFELTILVMIGTDCICSCKSNYHTITTTTAPLVYYYFINKMYSTFSWKKWKIKKDLIVIKYKMHPICEFVLKIPIIRTLYSLYTNTMYDVLIGWFWNIMYKICTFKVLWLYRSLQQKVHLTKIN